MSRPIARFVAALALAALPTPPAHAAWSPSGNPICVAPGAQYDPISAIPWIVWTDERNGTPQLYATQFGWYSGEPFPNAPVNGRPIAPSASAQRTPATHASDYDGSLLVVWSEDRGTGTGSDLYAMRLRLQDGAPDPSWPASGLQVCVSPGEQRNPRVYPYGILLPTWEVISLLYVTWEDARGGDSRIYATQVDFRGTIHTGWPANGILVSSGPADDRNSALLYGDEGFVTIWESAGRISAQAVSVTGVVPSNGNWPATGRTLSDPAFVASNAAAARIDVLSPLFGMYANLVAWEEQRGAQVQVRAQGWMEGRANTLGPEAILVVDDLLARPQSLQLVPNGLGRAQLHWQDVTTDAGDLYYVDLFNSEMPYPFLYAQLGGATPFLVAPGEQRNLTFNVWQHGIWQDSRSGIPQIHGVFYGPGSTPGGTPVAPTDAAQTRPSVSRQLGIIIPESPPLPVVVWTDHRNGSTGPDIYGQVLGPGGPGTVGVGDRHTSQLSCSPARPTPTRGAVSFQLRLPTERDVDMRVADVSGRVVRHLPLGRHPAGEHVLTWDGFDTSGTRVAPGLYWVHGRAGDERFNRRVVMISP